MKEHDVVRVIHEVKYDGNPDGGTEDENEFLTIPIGTQGTNVADYEDACEVEFQSLPTCFGDKGIFVLLIKKVDLEVTHAY
jgi:hypothetical protein